MILTPLEGKIHIRADGSRRVLGVYDPDTGAIEVRDRQNGETVKIPLAELVEAGRKLEAPRISNETT